MREHPLDVVLRPDTDAVTGFQAESAQAAGQVVDSLLQLPVGHALVLVADDQRFALAETPAEGIEMIADGFADQGLFARPVDVAVLFLHGVSSNSLAEWCACSNENPRRMPGG
ncbi:hypothetical protein SDC9_197499 [bioreactor metagenome]|uniref:Uncharacterized protein n=1 Tax=bioreactor metagenome TaxID=1076179 RepID=A0A645IF14_9ZZZZ